MSHFFLVVRLPEDTTLDTAQSRLEEALAPYNEDLDVAFEDVEDESRNEWETESTEHVVMPDGRRLLPWNKEAEALSRRVKLPRVQIPKKEMFPSFDDFMAEWCEIGRGGPNNRYGHMTNPHGEWDWWVVGGRWPQALNGKSGGRINEIDFNAILPAAPFAFLDPTKGVPDGWTAKSWRSNEAEDATHKAAFLTWVKSGNQRDWVFAVDCHS